MSQQYLKLSKNSQSAAVASNSTAEGPSELATRTYAADQGGKPLLQNMTKGKSEVQTFQKKINRRDLNLIPPSAAIVQSQQADYSTGGNGDYLNIKGGMGLTINSTQNKNGKTSGWENIGSLQNRVTTVKHEKGIPNGTIMQCLKQFQRTKQQRQGQQASEQATGANPSGSTKVAISLNSVIPVASQNVANMPVSTKSNKSQKSTKTRTHNPAAATMAAEVHAQRRQNFTCTTTTKGGLRLSKKSPSNGRDQPGNTLVNQGRIQQHQHRDRFQNTKVAQTQNYSTHKGARGSASQQPNAIANEKVSRQLQKTLKKQQGQNPGKTSAELQEMELETKFAMLLRKREERSNEPRPQQPEMRAESKKIAIMTLGGGNPYDPAKLISPNTTTNRQNSHETSKLLTLKHFQQAKQIQSSVVTPKYFKCKTGTDKTGNILGAGASTYDPKSDEANNEARSSLKTQSKSQISTHKISKVKQVGNTVGTTSSPDNKVRGDKSTGQNQTKSLSNNSRQKYQSQQTQAATTMKNVVKQSSKGINLQIKQKTTSQQPIAPQMRYSVPPDTMISHKNQAQQQVQSSSSALNGSSELQKRFTRGEIGSHHDASISSGKANKSFQFVHNTALMSCSSGGDSSNPPNPVRRRSSSGKNGKHSIKISHIQNVNPVIIQPGTSTSASINQNDASYLNLRTQIPQSTNNQKSGKRFTFTLNPRDQQKASRTSKHSSNQQQPQTTNVPNPATATATKTSQKPLAQQQQAPRDCSTQKSATKGKSISAKKGKAQGYSTTTQQVGKNLTFEKTGQKASGRIKKVAVKTPDEMWYETKQPVILPLPTHNSASHGQAIHQIPVYSTVGGNQVEIRRERHQKSNDSTHNSSFTVSKEKRVARKQKHSIDESQNLSSDMIVQQIKDSVIDESSQEIIVGQKRDSNQSKLSNNEYKQIAEELAMKDNLIAQLYEVLGKKEDQLNALSKNCEHLSSSLKARDEKRDRSQQAIKETLKNLEQKLHMFTEQSQQNQGGLRQITQSPYEAMKFNSRQQSDLNREQQQLDKRGGGAGSVDFRPEVNKEASATPNLSSHRMEPFKMSFQQNSQQRPTSNLLSVPNWDCGTRRPSAISDIDSLVTVAEFQGTQYDGYKVDGSRYELSATKKDMALAEPTIGSLGSDIQAFKRPPNEEKGSFPIFNKDDVDDMGEMTSLSEMEMSNVVDTSLLQLERDLVDTQQKLQEQSHKAAAFVKMQQNNFTELKSNLMEPNNQKNVILEDTEEAEEDDIAHMIPKKKQRVVAQEQHQMFMTQKINQNSKVRREFSQEAKEADVSSSLQPPSQVSSSFNNNASREKGLVHYTGKLSKTISKNKMKLKLASEIQIGQQQRKEEQAAAEVEQQQYALNKRAQEDGGGHYYDNAKNLNDSREVKAKKKIQLPLKISKATDSNKHPKSQERGGTTIASNSTNGAQQTQSFNSVTIMNFKNKAQISSQPQTYKSPRSRGGEVQVQGQGNMLSNRLSLKNSHQVVGENQPLMVQKVHRAGSNEENGARSRKEKRPQ